MNGPDFNSMSRARALLSLRIIWGSLLAGELVCLSVFRLGTFPQQQSPQPIFGLVALIGLVTVVPISFLIRRSILRRGGADGTVSASTRATASIIFWAGCAGVCFFALTAGLISSWTWPVVTCVCVTMGLQLCTFPRSSTER